MKKNNRGEHSRFLVNRQIRAPQVVCIDQEDRNCGVISIVDALRRAQDSGLDLVQIARNGEMPTCKIVDFSRFKYEQSKKERAQRKRQRETAQKVKEIKFRPSTDENDLRIKAKQAQAFIQEGHRLRITMMFRGREVRNSNLAQETLQKFLAMVPEAQLTVLPVISGKTLTAMAVRKNHVETPSQEGSIAS
jgi:translation initiation factor IF-3